ncbi:hypothetical protein CN151_23435 [Sinorhizobium meliloti]|nr:hypothetical protein CN151_23435 [Sinorhizobium meliloti]RVM86328.1 hypothetical protein CN119_29880 [Sinorhizobium meliloti]RVN04339.1 hypothetical protein CN112_25700 [Sinorhizobium meliloti]
MALALLVTCLPSIHASAANTPCSGSKGGIAGCRGETFLCNDGSVSGSKRSCTAHMGGAMGLIGGSGPNMAPSGDGQCSCRSGSYCTGPRGGRYCTTDGGGKSYLRN